MPLHLRPNPTSPLPPFTFAPPSPPPASPSQNDPTIDVEPRKYLPLPPADFIPERDMHMFGTYPLKGEAEAGRGLVRCRRCGKVVMEWALGAHRRGYFPFHRVHRHAKWLIWIGRIGICAHVLDGTPLVHKKSIKVGKDEGGKKRRASEGTPAMILTNIQPSSELIVWCLPVSESESASPHKKRPKLPSNEHLDPHLYKGLKKSEIKKLQKERMRVEKREAKEREKFEVAERKRQRGDSLPLPPYPPRHPLPPPPSSPLPLHLLRSPFPLPAPLLPSHPLIHDQPVCR